MQHKGKQLLRLYIICSQVHINQSIHTAHNGELKERQRDKGEKAGISKHDETITVTCILFK